MRRTDFLFTALLLLMGFSGEAQVSRRDLDDIERHRRQVDLFALPAVIGM